MAGLFASRVCETTVGLLVTGPCKSKAAAFPEAESMVLAPVPETSTWKLAALCRSRSLLTSQATQAKRIQPRDSLFEYDRQRRALPRLQAGRRVAETNGVDNAGLQCRSQAETCPTRQGDDSPDSLLKHEMPRQIYSVMFSLVTQL